MIKNYYGTMAFVMAAIFAGSGAQAQGAGTGENKVYIEQIGSSNTITIQQVGGTNSVGGVTNQSATTVDAAGITTLTPAAPSATNYGTVTGKNNQVTI